MEVICLEEPAFFELLERVVARLKDQQGIKADQWISAEEAMEKLHITSKTTLQKYRDEGKIRFSQSGKHIVYDRQSIADFFEKNAKEPF